MNTEHKKPVGSRPPVKTKRDFVRRYAKGEFGNASPTWDTLNSWIHDYKPHDKFYHIRNRVAGGPTWYNIPVRKLINRWNKIVCGGVDPKSLYISAMAPTEKTILQGEVRRSERGLELTYTRVKKPMRDALAEETLTVYGYKARCILESVMAPGEFDWLCELLDNYEDHTVEFSVYSEPWGTIPNCRTVWWEVRRY